ncbi:hypothetical protein SDJN02_16129, partial [Cucurbita argyrosperma subsp. argyrosperma]
MIEEWKIKVNVIAREEKKRELKESLKCEATKEKTCCSSEENFFSLKKKLVYNGQEKRSLWAKQPRHLSKKEKTSGNEVVSAQHAEDLKMKRKRKARARENNLRGRNVGNWKAARENVGGGEAKMAKQESNLDCTRETAYRRAKAVKAVNKALDSGKIVKQNQKTKKILPNRTQIKIRGDAREECSKNDMSEQKQKTTWQWRVQA